MTSQRRTLSSRHVFALAASLAASLLTVGCGIGTIATGSSDALVAGPMAGQLKGGPNPIVGANISVWVTGTITGGVLTGQGYGQGTRMQSVVSGANGSFNFSGGYACPAGQFLYLTSAGGDTGAGTNNVAVLVAALGRCEDLYSNGKYTGAFIYMNELTTVAAAYALNGFATSSGNGSNAIVGIGAPATNNDPTGTTTASAGLRHAFQNAANLVNINQPSVSANFTVPSNATATVPTQVINSIANTLVACVNTNGGTGSGSCGTVFGATGTNGTSGNTFLAMLNLAKNPSLAGGSATQADFLNASSAATNFYMPMLTTAPRDYSIAIQYPRGTGAGPGRQGLQYPFTGILDAGDNYYVGNSDGATPSRFNLVSFNSNGTLASFTADTATGSQVFGLSADGAGHLYRSETSSGNLFRYSVDNTTGAITPTPTATIGTLGGSVVYSAVDKRNNVWLVANNIPYIGVVNSGSNTVTNFYQVPSAGAQIAVDPNQNIWVTDTNSAQIAGNMVTVLQNTGTASSPGYSGSEVNSGSLAGASADGIAFVSTTPTTYTGYITNQTTTGGITPVVPTLAGSTVTALTPGSQTTTNFATPNTVRADGSGKLWVSDTASSALLQFVPGASFATQYSPCIPASPSSNTTCTSNNSANDVEIDSTGSIWITHPSTGSISQLIGAAAPTVPLLSVNTLSRP